MLIAYAYSTEISIAATSGTLSVLVLPPGERGQVVPDASGQLDCFSYILGAPACLMKLFYNREMQVFLRVGVGISPLTVRRKKVDCGN